MVGTEGIAPSSSCMSGRRSAAELRPLNWCSRLGSHQRPPPSDDGALLTELQERIGKGWSGRPDSCRRSPARHAGAFAARLRPDSNGGRDGTRTHFFHRDRVESRLFVFTPYKLAPGAGVAPSACARPKVPLQRRLNCFYSIREWWAARDS